MQTELFIAQRLFFNKEKSFSAFIISIAKVAIALSVAVMIIAVSFINGFQKEISNKVFGFFGQIQVSKFGYGKSLEDNPIDMRQAFYQESKKLPQIKYLQSFAYKAGILKANSQIEGIVLKGVGADFNWNYFKKNIVSGNIISLQDSVASNELLISLSTAKRLNVKVNDKVSLHFMQNPPRVRNMKIAGIYNTGMEEYDKVYALMDIKQIQRLNNWEAHQVAGFELFVNNTDSIYEIANDISYNYLPPDLVAQTIMEIRPNIFDWLQLQDMNELIILLLMLIVAAVNMITCLLIIILERSNMIGILKSLGAGNWFIRKIFIYNALYIVAAGLFWGNLFGIGIVAIQYYFKLITLPEASYYVKYAPVDFNVLSVLLINAGTFFICFIILLLPSYLVSKIPPVKVLRFE